MQHGCLDTVLWCALLCVVYGMCRLCCTGSDLSVLPRNPVPGAAKWLLKMHGCVSEPEDIVLTRRDYIRYSENRCGGQGVCCRGHRERGGLW